MVFCQQTTCTHNIMYYIIYIVCLLVHISWQATPYRTNTLLRCSMRSTVKRRHVGSSSAWPSALMRTASAENTSHFPPSENRKICLAEKKEMYTKNISWVLQYWCWQVAPHPLPGLWPFAMLSWRARFKTAFSMTIKQYALDLTFLTWFCAQVTASAFIVRVASPTGANRAQLRIPNRSSTSATAGRIFSYWFISSLWWYMWRPIGKTRGRP